MTTDLRFQKPTCPGCGVRKEGTYIYDEAFDDLVCQSCREHGDPSSAHRDEPLPLSPRSRRNPVGRTLDRIASQSILAGVRSTFPRRIT